MKQIDLTLATPEENLAADEAFLDWCEEGHFAGEMLRFWESPEYFVVVGYSGKVSEEVNETVCRLLRIPIFRRASGGGTVVQGPGCLNYSLILRVESRKETAGITETNCHILSKHREALLPLAGNDIRVSGISDLALGDRKFSGNAQRRKKNCVLFHGTILIDFELARIQNLLPPPPRQPEYRKDRAHEKFLTNLGAAREDVKSALAGAWNASEELKGVPHGRIESLARDRYASKAWNFKFR